MKERDSGFFLIDVAKHKALATKHISQVVKIFEDFNINYWMEYGTLLGAVREKGFIPWDSEFDVGVWYKDYVQHEKKLVQRFKQLGFNVDLRKKDRVKLTHPAQKTGSYKIDIHTYHQKGNSAYVSFNRPLKHKGFLNNAWNLIYQQLRLSLPENQDNYPMGVFIKAIMNHQGIIPEVFYYKKGKYISSQSFLLKHKEVIIDNNSSMKLISKIGNAFAKVILGIIPVNLKRRIVKKVDNRVKKKVANSYYIQSIPAHFYQELTKIPFEDIYLNAPKDHFKYLEMVYGSDWNIRKHNWKGTDIKILKKT